MTDIDTKKNEIDFFQFLKEKLDDLKIIKLDDIRDIYKEYFYIAKKKCIEEIDNYVLENNLDKKLYNIDNKLFTSAMKDIAFSRMCLDLIKCMDRLIDEESSKDKMLLKELKRVEDEIDFYDLENNYGFFFLN